MTREEILNYLMERRKLTAPVADMRNKLNEAMKKRNKALKKGWGAIVVLAVLAYLVNDGEGVKTSIIAVGIIIFLLIRKVKIYLDSSKIIEEERNNLAEAEGQKAYQDGLRGFPEKFYNYSDVYRLWKLVNEGRADSLREAYNLLETQHFYEDQAAVQEEIRNLQQDVASAGKTTAVASVVTAYNSFRK